MMSLDETLSDNDLLQVDRVEMLMMQKSSPGMMMSSSASYFEEEIIEEIIEEDEGTTSVPETSDDDKKGGTVPGFLWGTYPAPAPAAPPVPEQPKISKYMERKRREIKLEIAGLEAQLDFMDLLSQMSDPEKMKLLFNVVDKDRSGQISGAELALALKRRQPELPWHEALEKAVNSVAIFDRNGDDRLDRTEFEDYIQVLLAELNETFQEYAEFMVLQSIFSGKDVNQTMMAIEQEVSSPEFQQEIDERVHFRREMLEVLVDEKLFELFSLLDKGEKFCLSFRDVANGLYALTKDMEQSARLTKDMFLLIDQREAEIQYHQAKHQMETSEESKDDGLPSLPAPQGREFINIEEFGRLMIALVAHQQKEEPHLENSFGQLADFFIFTWNNYQQEYDEHLSGMANLMIADDTLKEYMQQSKVNQVSYRTKMNHEDRLRQIFNLWEMTLKESDGEDLDGKKSKSRGKIPIARVQQALDHFELLRGIDQNNSSKRARSFLSFVEKTQELINAKDFIKIVSDYSTMVGLDDMHEVIDFLGLCISFSMGRAAKIYSSTYLHQHEHSSSDDGATKKKNGKHHHHHKKKKHVPLNLPASPAKMSQLLENEDEDDEESVLEFRV